jgi:hypothetical protein
MHTAVVETLVSDWLAGDYGLFDACCDEPEAAWDAILTIAHRPLTEEQAARLAAGPLETLLSQHGPAFIDRVERLADLDPRFNHLLGGVWRCDMADEVWDRVRRVRRATW